MTLKRLTGPIRRLGAANGLLFLLGRLLQKISNGHWRLLRYHIVAQPIPGPAALNCRPSPHSAVERTLPDSAICAAFPRPKNIVAARFRNGYTCLAATVKGRFAGFFWYARNFYEEDEVRCRFELADPGASVWDFDVHVEPDFRMGRTLARLWSAANELLEKKGIRWSFSRISAFNQNSLAAHGHLGMQRIETLTFLCLGQIQFTFSSKAPFVDCCWPGRAHPTITLGIPEATQPRSQSERPHAVVVGLCAHGLGIARSLHRAGIQVVALKRDPALPGARTRCAEIRFIPDITGPGLVTSLIQLASDSDTESKPVLFLTNDLMVKTVGEHVQEISRFYRLSWAHAAPAVLDLLEKDHLEQRCIDTGLRYPRSTLLSNLQTLEQDIGCLELPIILKPTRPLSAFKVIVIDSMEDIPAYTELIGQCLPVLAQEFIPGDDRSIRFGALYLKKGEVLARFEGRKLCSRPMGNTTIAVSEPNDQVHALTLRFFAGLGLSGPVSLELKQGPDGTFWVIEPTVGRTDFWEGLCSANGVSLPLTEYFAAIGGGPVGMRQTTSTLWINSERQPGAFFWLLRHEPGLFFRQRLRDVYFDLNDPHPFIVAMRNFLAALPIRMIRKARTLLLRQIPGG